MLYYIVLCLTIVAYLAAFACAWRSLYHRPAQWPTHIAGTVAVLLHLALLAHITLMAHSLMLGFGSALSLFAWQTAVLLLLFNLRQPATALGIVIFPAAAAAVLVNLALPVGDEVLAPLQWSVQTHILVSLLAYGVLTLAAVQAAILALQHRKLHNRIPDGTGIRLPALQTMEHGLFELIVLGFVLLTLTITSGAVFIDDMFAQNLAHKTILTIAAWLFFAVLLLGRWRYGWRGRVAVRWVVAGYVLLILAYFGDKFILEQILDKHWFIT